MPFLEGPVCGDERALVLIAPVDELEQQIGVPVGILQIPDRLYQ